MAQDRDLFLGCFSLGKATPRDRARAAAKAGFAGLSLSWAELMARRAAGEDLAVAGAELRDLGLQVTQLEIVPLAAREALADFRAVAADVARAAAQVGCSVVHAVARDGSRPLEDFIDSFRVLADACGQEDLECGIEFVPHITAVPDLASALNLVRAAGRRNAGVVFDSLHFVRSGAPWSALEALDPADVVSLQINDGPLRPTTDDYFDECMRLRQPPGEGAFDLVRLMDALWRIGVRVSPSVEVMSEELDVLSPDAAAARLADGARSVMAKQKTGGQARGVPQPSLQGEAT